MTCLGYFFNYASCVEEGRYCQSPHTTLRELHAHADLLQPLNRWYKETFGRSVFEEVAKPRLLDPLDLPSVRTARVTQLVLFLCAAMVLRQRSAPTHTAGYSLGYGAAFALSGVLPFPAFVHDVFSANYPYANDNHTALQEDRLRSCILYDPTEPAFGVTVANAIRRHFPEVVVKDDRPPYCMQVVAAETVLDALRAWVFRSFPASASHSTRMIRSDAAHLYPDRYQAVKAAFRQAAYGVPGLDIVTHQHGVLGQGRFLEDGGGVLFDAIQAPLSMRRVVDVLVAYRGPLIMFGSARTADFVFFGLGNKALNRPVIDWEQALLLRDAPIVTASQADRR
ncbi:hypothetical protein BKK80_33335 [Cupriavidus malaysiensis]|uniref:Uncharacterized protein n=2 Tax=Cupriavidus malaysiensis TaxID=367825 RepID=A0ABN4TTZ0_9BURK|nr:hypothetical protein BKK80_33335 [Cupriavidus malaysiensis]